MNWVKTLPNIDTTGNKYSQYGEEVVIREIFANIGVTDRYFVDIGAGGAGRNLSNTRLLTEGGWRGLSFDMDGSPGTIKEFIKPNNILRLLRRYGCPLAFDFLSVDIDSFDHDVIQNILSSYKPRVICAEYNATLDPSVSVKLRYEDGYTWDGTNKYGFSFGAGLKLFSAFDYTVIHNHKDTNMFAVHNSLLQGIGDIRITARQNIYHPINTKAIWELV